MTEAQMVERVGNLYALGPMDCLLLVSFVGFIFYFIMKKRSTSMEKNDLVGLSIEKKKNDSVVTQSVNVPPAATGFLSKMKNSGKKIAIFYGSQTGTAEEFSHRVSKDCQRYNLKAGVFDPEEFDMSELIELKEEIPDSLVVFFLATYGEGDPTDNAIPFNEWLLDDHELEGLNFAVFALGNKTYEHYQAFGRLVDKRFEELGGNRICERGEGDDDANIEEDFLVWREKFWEKVCAFYCVRQDGLKRSLSSCVSRDFELVKHKDLSQDEIFNGEITKLGAFKNQRPPYDAKNPYMASVLVNRELHKGGPRSCVHVEIGIKNSGIRYEAGDHVAVYPTNDLELVSQLAKLLFVDLDLVFSLNNVDSEASKFHPFPCPTTVRTALMHYVDITSTVKHHVLCELITYTKDEEDIKKLKKLCNTNEEGKKFYNEWIVNDHRHITNVLEDLSSCKPPFDLLLELLPRLQSRYYSISSSSKMHKDSIHITAAVVQWTARTDRPQKGVATNWLQGKLPGEETRIPIFVRHTTFRLPEKHHLPILMVGPGTGLAPFRGFIQERHTLIEAGVELKDASLYFGCRNKAHDFIYEDELNGYIHSGAITNLSLAFSRDQQEKCYVTHKIKENLLSVWQIIKDGGHIYVCGDAKNMAKDVHNLIIDALKIHGEKTTEQANNFVKNLSNKGRYSVDVW